ncbi:MAG: cyoA [Ilumatobacteraceae bacterium]|nr:cyoA [Ilumatobacteraceae bacterium]
MDRETSFARRRWWLIAVLPVLVALGVFVGFLIGGGGVPSFGMPDPVTVQGRRTHTLWQILFIAAMGVGALVWGLIAWSVLRFRRGDDDERIPSQKAYNIPMEIVYTVLPILAIIAVFIGTVIVQDKNNALSAAPDVTIDVTGFQWQWKFVYPNDGVTVIGDSEPDTTPQIVLPVDSTIRFELTTADVIHSFWVPDFLTKRDLIPGVHNVIEVHTTKTGTYAGRCAEFCGINHAIMNFEVKVVTRAEYEQWIATHRSTAPTTTAAASATSTVSTG